MNTRRPTRVSHLVKMRHVRSIHSERTVLVLHLHGDDGASLAVLRGQRKGKWGLGGLGTLSQVVRALGS